MATLQKHLLALMCSGWLVVMGACGDDKKPGQSPSDRDRDAGLARDAGEDAEAPEPDCYDDPKTYNQIINACTDAEQVDKVSELPLLLPNGELPPLP